MLKRLLGLIFCASLAFAGMANAQSATTAAPSGTATTKPAAPMPMPMMSGMMPKGSDSSDGITAGQVAAVGVGVVAGVVLFQGAMWHGMVIMGALVGGYVGDYLYNLHTDKKTAS